ncbi:MAG: hypothetical protein JWR42_1736 [Marmoricola sp.]|nr:hypothetical protein [Marmoricola sp.]
MAGEEAHLAAQEARVAGEEAHLAAEEARVAGEEAHLAAEEARVAGEEAHVVRVRGGAAAFAVSVPKRWVVRRPAGR